MSINGERLNGFQSEKGVLQKETAAAIKGFAARPVTEQYIVADFADTTIQFPRKDDNAALARMESFLTGAARLAAAGKQNCQ